MFRYLGRLFNPQRQHSRRSGAGSRQSADDRSRSEGDVRIEYPSDQRSDKKKYKEDALGGEYVEFEEVD